MSCATRAWPSASCCRPMVLVTVVTPAESRRWCPRLRLRRPATTTWRTVTGLGTARPERLSPSSASPETPARRGGRRAAIGAGAGRHAGGPALDMYGDGNVVFAWADGRRLSVRTPDGDVRTGEASSTSPYGPRRATMAVQTDDRRGTRRPRRQAPVGAWVAASAPSRRGHWYAPGSTQRTVDERRPGARLANPECLVDGLPPAAPDLLASGGRTRTASCSSWSPTTAAPPTTADGRRTGAGLSCRTPVPSHHRPPARTARAPAEDAFR